MRFVVPGLVFIGALACFWASFTSKTIYQADADKLLAAPKPMPPWRARIFWMFCGLVLLLVVWSMLDYSARVLT